MIFPSLSIGASSLKAQQKAMDVVSNNIANANTPDYSRQQVSLANLEPQKLGPLAFGRGVDVAAIRRVVDPLLVSAQTGNATASGYWQGVEGALAAIEPVFGSLSANDLSRSVSAFFQAWQQLANNPQDQAAKVHLRSQAQALVDRIGSMRGELTRARQGIAADLDAGVAEANRLLDRIAALNAEIQRLENTGSATAGPANDLRDQRDAAIRQLAALIPVQRVATSDGSLLIQTTQGDLLVQADQARHLARTAGGIAVAETGTGIALAAGDGRLGALIDADANYLGRYLAALDSLAANLAFGVNQAYAQGATSSGHTSLVSGESSNPLLPLSDPAQPNPLAANVQSGSFTVHVFDAAGNPNPPGGTTIAVTAGVTTMTDLANALNAVPGITASVDAAGRLNLSAAAGGSFAFSGDTSNVLAAFGINGFFKGHDAATLSLADPIAADASAIHTGALDPATSRVAAGDNSIALAVLDVGNTALSADGTTAASLHARATGLSTGFGTDLAAARQQTRYLKAEAEALQARRDAISGVNVDEEMIAMIQFQRAYQAAAKVIATSNQMLDSLMGMLR